MIINITQHCTLRCEHCMQCAGPERNECMSRETLRKAAIYAQRIDWLLSGDDDEKSLKERLEEELKELEEQ